MNILDISHHQNDKGPIDFVKIKKDGYDAVIMKCTESTNFLDNKFQSNKKGARDAGLLCGYYHFARANDYKKEAEWFLKNVGDIGEGEFLALDYEIHTLSDPADWCRKWLDYVESKVGFKPLFYTYHAFLLKYNWKKVSDGNFGLWAARYGSKYVYIPHQLCLAPTSATWPFWVIWQYSSKGKVNGVVGNVDVNYAKITLETLKKYGKPKKEPICNHSCPKCCN